MKSDEEQMIEIAIRLKKVEKVIQESEEKIKEYLKDQRWLIGG